MHGMSQLCDDEIGASGIVGASFDGLHEGKPLSHSAHGLLFHRFDGEVGANPRLGDPQVPLFERVAEPFRLDRKLVADAANCCNQPEPFR